MDPHTNARVSGEIDVSSAWQRHQLPGLHDVCGYVQSYHEERLGPELTERACTWSLHPSLHL